MAKIFISSTSWTDDDRHVIHPHSSSWVSLPMATCNKALVSCYLAPIFKLLCDKSAVHAKVSTIFFLAGTDPVLMLIGIAAWKGVSQRVKEEYRLLDGIKRESWPEKPSRKLNLLGTYTKITNSRNLEHLRGERFNFWLRGTCHAIFF